MASRKKSEHASEMTFDGFRPGTIGHMPFQTEASTGGGVGSTIISPTSQQFEVEEQRFKTFSTNQVEKILSDAQRRLDVKTHNYKLLVN
mmetsp:Transcript_41011/g.62401  ORF Transcript_41011/g.62401 Transcript_41011/m.62401 type:complete len:89 (+) Transcript_41011:1439-1705(+)